MIAVRVNPSRFVQRSILACGLSRIPGTDSLQQDVSSDGTFFPFIMIIMIIMIIIIIIENIILKVCI